MPQIITKLTPQVWVGQSELYEFNSGVVLSDGQACIIDPGLLPAEIKSLAGLVNGQAVSSQVLLLTHSHWDHLLGAAYFSGTKIIAHENYRSQVQREDGDRIYKQVAKWDSQSGIERSQPFVIPQPDETFSDRLDLAVGSLNLHLIHAPGHAPDQLVIYEPEEGILLAGDMLSDSEIPYIMDNLAAYERSLATLSNLEVSALVPGHGTPTTAAHEIQDRIQADRSYLAELRDQISFSIGQGLTIAETVARCTNTTDPKIEANAGAHQMNIESVYMELGGEADPAQTGWHKS